MLKKQKSVEKKNFLGEIVGAGALAFALFRFTLGYRKCVRCAHYGKCHCVKGEWGWCLCDEMFDPEKMRARPARNGNMWRRCRCYSCKV